VDVASGVELLLMKGGRSGVVGLGTSILATFKIAVDYSKDQKTSDFLNTLTVVPTHFISY
jgi:hypothetical protein